MTPSEDQASHAAAGPGRFLYPVLLALITAAFCAWVLSLPLFPTQDGPIHLYYTSILHDLLFHTSSLYPRFYTVKHVLPPYALYYYLLMLLAKAVPIVTADKLVICLYMVCFVSGIRFLANSLNPRPGRAGDLAALLATPLLLNWPLAMGFVNFCLSTAFALWAMGLWCRSSLRQSHPRKLAFVFLAFLIMLTHPVPLIFLLGFCIVELLVRLLQQRSLLPPASPASRPAPGSLLHDLLYLALASTTLLYVKLFTASNVLQQQPPVGQSGAHLFIHDLKSYLLLHTLSIFNGSTLLDVFHRCSLVLLLVGSLSLAVLQLRRNLDRESWTLADTWTCIALLAAFGMPLVPNDLNHSHFFAYRLVLLVWIAAIIAASGYRLPHKLLRPACAAFAVLASMLVLVLAYRRITPSATQIAYMETLPAIASAEPAAAQSGSLPGLGNHVGLMLLSLDHLQPTGLTYDPYFWATAHFFRRTGSVLYDSPWLDLAIIPIGPQPSMPTAFTDPRLLEVLLKLRQNLQSSPATRQKFLGNVDFVLINSGSTPAASATDPLLRLDAIPWTCRPYGWYSLCTRSPHTSPTPETKN